VLYLEIEDGNQASVLLPVSIGRWQRTHHYYPDRTTTAWADFDKNTWTFRLGTAQDAAADLEIGVTATDLPETLLISSDIWGSPQQIDSRSLLGLRLDYFDGQAYTHSVMVHGPAGTTSDIHSPTRVAAMPWGTKRSPDNDFLVENLDKFSLRLADHAPATWNGKIQITAIMDNVGPHAGARVRLRPA
jgi:hypothetical protein